MKKEEDSTQVEIRRMTKDNTRAEEGNDERMGSDEPVVPRGCRIYLYDRTLSTHIGRQAAIIRGIGCGIAVALTRLAGVWHGASRREGSHAL